MPGISESTVLLFYKEYEFDRYFRGDRYVRRVLRPAYNLIRRDQMISGYYIWFLNLAKALRRTGHRVAVNNFALARRFPEHPVALVGYPVLLEGWSLPNPAILGPGLYAHPMESPELMRDPRYHYYLVTCGWMEDLFRPFYGEATVQWYAGIDLDEWTDTIHRDKCYDVLVYDKIRWNRDQFESQLLQPILRELTARGLRITVLRYGSYTHQMFQQRLAQSRSMIFLCEHEAQGLAYQEAMASNVPILAWDNGFWLDPNRPKWQADPVPATSVPYFSPECGERFRAPNDFSAAFATFWQNVDLYHPREYVRHTLPLAGSAETFMHYYRALMR